MAGTKFVYPFEEADSGDKRLLGGKGAGLARMTQMGLPVPPGFTVTTEACRQYYSSGERFPDGLADEVRTAMKELERKTGKSFGGSEDPLLVSVRSGAAMSMPGMMDTILNLGMNDEVVAGFAEATGNPRFAYDAYRRLIQAFGEIAMGADEKRFVKILEAAKESQGATYDYELTVESLRKICEDYKQAIKKDRGQEFPQDPWKQLDMAVEAVFGSWMRKRAVDYRREFKITPAMADGTAVNVQTMVFGNMGNDSATGVAFTRDPATGENELYGEYLVNAQGEDVVAGIRTPKPIAELEDEMPEIWTALQEVRRTLEEKHREVQDFEFTIERGTLYLLQTRNGKMNAAAFVKTSCDMVEEDILDQTAALLRISPAHLEQLLHRRIDPTANAEPIASGLPASPGAASGAVVFDADEAERRGREGEAVILVREETKPEDIHGFFQARGILTSRGGKTSHAAVVARGMGKPCVVGAEAIRINDRERTATVGEHEISEGDVVTIDGGSGSVYLGEVPTVDPEFGDDMKTLLDWADAARSLGVRANADTPDDAAIAREMGAQGIGLCRTERMFNAADRLPIVREMILSSSDEERQAAIDQLRPMQKSDFIGIFKAMEGLPVTIRLLDPPLHEFLPSLESLLIDLSALLRVRDRIDTGESEVEALREVLEPSVWETLPPIGKLTTAGDGGVRGIDRLIAEKQAVLQKVRETSEVNPMLGHRGVRLGITYPALYAMQIGAILEALAECRKEEVDAVCEIMVPQVTEPIELQRVQELVDEVRASVEERYGVTLDFKFGTMIEAVRACVRADAVAASAEFFSFGTNDLTQATFSFSREDAEQKFLPAYVEMGVLPENPFEALDIQGVARLMKLAVEKGRATKPELKIGICGEHGGHPRSIEYCHLVGLDYVSCSAYRVPIARLAAAQAALRERERTSDERQHPDYPFNLFV
ncbi:MAG: pyruvate, phosphate dikinase [Gemmatimonadetes bacterium]|uniref:Pyruvate, phosphate dikinase n=1 Tax=Candidatus Kutchimonas denitrificans TaxID=3056748 RepID=A0AAE4Z9Q3_9BACT|nr:pyruvate, phosphate dikinase [Gemmatimonadota bacterium]NIR76389.1 pyruvate, phosphate dikinase [Candidatus Kutchimonas denitrificans]NIS03199.1 pyruvate, phosphate dikinase [Gemmatimonadota bacterium]NIT66372.1 pyruvate, phosphate dikinase [Gemmatimonadota bacterium]NIU54451.1 pyruvate, phosphate dikinase [Gemmatimonadota bacterium]